jgi:hypothetical protein
MEVNRWCHYDRFLASITNEERDTQSSHYYEVKVLFILFLQIRWSYSIMNTEKLCAHCNIMRKSSIIMRKRNNQQIFIKKNHPSTSETLYKRKIEFAILMDVFLFVNHLFLQRISTKYQMRCPLFRNVTNWHQHACCYSIIALSENHWNKHVVAFDPTKENRYWIISATYIETQ